MSAKVESYPPMSDEQRARGKALVEIFEKADKKRLSAFVDMLALGSELSVVEQEITQKKVDAYRGEGNEYGVKLGERFLHLHDYRRASANG